MEIDFEFETYPTNSSLALRANLGQERGKEDVGEILKQVIESIWNEGEEVVEKNNGSTTPVENFTNSGSPQIYSNEVNKNEEESLFPKLDEIPSPLSKNSSDSSGYVSAEMEQNERMDIVEAMPSVSNNLDDGSRSQQVQPGFNSYLPSTTGNFMVNTNSCPATGAATGSYPVETQFTSQTGEFMMNNNVFASRAPYPVTGQLPYSNKNFIMNGSTYAPSRSYPIAGQFPSANGQFTMNNNSKTYTPHPFKNQYPYATEKLMNDTYAYNRSNPTAPQSNQNHHLWQKLNTRKENLTSGGSVIIQKTSIPSLTCDCETCFFETCWTQYQQFIKESKANAWKKTDIVKPNVLQILPAVAQPDPTTNSSYPNSARLQQEGPMKNVISNRSNHMIVVSLVNGKQLFKLPMASTSERPPDIQTKPDKKQGPTKPSGKRVKRKYVRRNPEESNGKNDKLRVKRKYVRKNKEVSSIKDSAYIYSQGKLPTWEEFLKLRMEYNALKNNFVPSLPCPSTGIAISSQAEVRNEEESANNLHNNICITEEKTHDEKMEIEQEPSESKAAEEEPENQKELISKEPSTHNHDPSINETMQQDYSELPSLGEMRESNSDPVGGEDTTNSDSVCEEATRANDGDSSYFNIDLEELYTNFDNSDSEPDKDHKSANDKGLLARFPTIDDPEPHFLSEHLDEESDNAGKSSATNDNDVRKEETLSIQNDLVAATSICSKKAIFNPFQFLPEISDSESDEDELEEQEISKKDEVTEKVQNELDRGSVTEEAIFIPTSDFFPEISESDDDDVLQEHEKTLEEIKKELEIQNDALKKALSYSCQHISELGDVSKLYEQEITEKTSKEGEEQYLQNDSHACATKEAIYYPDTHFLSSSDSDSDSDSASSSGSSSDSSSDSDTSSDSGSDSDSDFESDDDDESESEQENDLHKEKSNGLENESPITFHSKKETLCNSNPLVSPETSLSESDSDESHEKNEKWNHNENGMHYETANEILNSPDSHFLSDSSDLDDWESKKDVEKQVIPKPNKIKPWFDSAEKQSHNFKSQRDRDYQKEEDELHRMLREFTDLPQLISPIYEKKSTLISNDYLLTSENGCRSRPMSNVLGSNSRRQMRSYPSDDEDEMGKVDLNHDKEMTLEVYNDQFHQKDGIHPYVEYKECGPFSHLRSPFCITSNYSPIYGDPNEFIEEIHPNPVITESSTIARRVKKSHQVEDSPQPLCLKKRVHPIKMDTTCSTGIQSTVVDGPIAYKNKNKLAPTLQSFKQVDQKNSCPSSQCPKIYSQSPSDTLNDSQKCSKNLLESKFMKSRDKRETVSGCEVKKPQESKTILSKPKFEETEGKTKALLEPKLNKPKGKLTWGSQGPKINIESQVSGRQITNRDCKNPSEVLKRRRAQHRIPLPPTKARLCEDLNKIFVLGQGGERHKSEESQVRAGGSLEVSLFIPGPFERRPRARKQVGSTS